MSRDDDIFAAALGLAPEAQAAFLDQACGGDAALRARIMALLCGHGEAASFLEPPSAPWSGLGAEEKPGDVLGRYTLLKKIGEGGCGVVYLAEQQEPVRRHVALKVIKLGMDTRHVIARFANERQVLALMDHSGIARVFDAGATEAGRPFFVMELVEGMPITRFCDERGLTLAARLELFARVCLAVQHAHQKGIIHRDLKPSNILVAIHDGAPAPKIIDFGIAKATQGRVGAASVHTRVDQLIGTPAYMSPEQIENAGGDIDTRSDIYALGVLLYELLAGRPPFAPQTLDSGGFEAWRRLICHTDPPPPSARLTALPDAERAAIAQQRRGTPAQLFARLRRDLDWIVLRCLEKDRTRRYATALELAEEVRRHLRQEPVQARPPETIYRVRKFIARNRLACASAAAIAAALIAGTAISIRQAVRATRAEHAARAERDAATAAQRAEALARGDAQRRQDQAEELLAFMLGDFRGELKKVGQLALLEKVGAKAADHLAGLNPRDLTDTALVNQAKTLTQIGETLVEQEHYTEAKAAFDLAHARAATLAERRPRDGNVLFERAQTEYWMGLVALRRGQQELAAEWLGRYRDSSLTLATLEPSNPRSHQEIRSAYHNLAVVELDRGNLAGAKAGFLGELASVETAAAAEPGNLALGFRVADVRSWLGRIAEREGDLAGALRWYARQTAQLEMLCAAEPGNTKWTFYLADSLSLQSTVLAITGRRQEALAALERARPINDALVARDPANRPWAISGLYLRLQRAALLASLGERAKALTEAATARRKLQEFAAAEPSKRPSSLLQTAWRLEAQCLAEQNSDAAREATNAALEFTPSATRNAPPDGRALGELAQACLMAGHLAAAARDTDAARQHWQRAIDLLLPILGATGHWRVLDPAARALALLGRDDESRALIERLSRSGYQPLEPWPRSFPP